MPCRHTHLLLLLHRGGGGRLEALQVLLQRFVLAFQLRHSGVPHLPGHLGLGVELEVQHPGGGGIVLASTQPLLFGGQGPEGGSAGRERVGGFVVEAKRHFRSEFRSGRITALSC